jgi:hypothetical protein
MGAQAGLTPAGLGVAPGGEVVAEIVVTNTGRLVDSFTLEVLGPAAEWTVCEPPTVSVFPGQSASAHVIFRPPVDGSVPAGPLTFGVHVVSHEDPQGSVVAEGVLDVEAVTVLSAEMSPRTGRARGRRRSKHQVAVDNRGNAPTTVELVGFDDQDAVDVSVAPALVDIDAGSAVFVTVRARARHPFWKGPGQTKPFAVEARTPAAPSLRVSGTLLNEATIPGWLPKAVAAVLALAVALVALWFGLFKPAVKDTATDAANNAAKAALSSAGITPGAGNNGGGGGGGGPATPTTIPPTTTTSKPSPSPTKAKAKPTKAPLPPPADFGQTLTLATPNLAADSKHQIQVTDVVFQNPALDQGRLSISRDGQVLYDLPLQAIPFYDTHQITPIIVPSGQSLTMRVTCQNPGGKACSPTVFVAGSVVTLAL